MTKNGRSPAAGVGRDDLATGVQVKVIYETSERLGMAEEEVNERCFARYGRIPQELSVREASVIITKLQKQLESTESAPVGEEPPAPAEPPQKTPEGRISDALLEASFVVVYSLGGSTMWARKDGASVYVNIPVA